MKKNHINQTSRAISVLREELRQQSMALAEQLSRSVSRLTSVDMLPCEEYGEEVCQEQVLAEKLFYMQRCRGALERCIARGSGKLRFHWSSGAVTETVFFKTEPSRVRVEGLLLGEKALSSQKKQQRASV